MQRLCRFLSMTLLAIPWLAISAAGANIRDVSISPSFFNPSAGQSAAITFVAATRGQAKVTILDRDRFPVRVLPPVTVAPGRVAVRWDGRDDAGAVVPDEAWNLRIELAGETYDPSRDFVAVMEDPQPRTYSRIDGVLSYRLSRPSRVHIEAGQAMLDPSTGLRNGPVLKTIVNREPRTAGAVIERWAGFDESGAIRVCDLPDFVIGVLATSLPDGSIITRGNRRTSFLDYAKQHRPAAALTARKLSAPAHHHAGLNAFEDHSPSLRVQRSWMRDGALRVQVNVEGPSAAHFLQQPGEMTVYVDERRVVATDVSQHPLVVTIPASKLRAGERRVAINWNSKYGPAATAAFLLEVAQ